MDNESNKLDVDRKALITAMYDAASRQSNYHIVNAIDSIEENTNKHYLSLSQDTEMQVSYAKCEEDIYNNKRRIRTTLGKYLSRQCSILEYITDVELDSFVTNVWAIINSYNKLDVKILTGEDIIKFYKSCDGSSHSCMTGKKAHFTEFYAINPDKVSLLVYDRIRALLWTCDDGTKVLDRAYPSHHYKIETLRRWAKIQGYVLREKADTAVWIIGDNDGDDDTHINLDDSSIKTITMNAATKNGLYPYLDTFCFGTIKDKKLVLSNDYKDSDIIVRSQCGIVRNSKLCECCECEVGISAGYSNLFEGNDYCDECFDRKFCICNECGIILSFDDATEIKNDYYCEDCKDDIGVSCVECDSFVDEDDCILYNDEYYCSYCASASLKHCKECGDRIHVCDADKYKGNFYCCDCYKKLFTHCTNCDLTIYIDDAENYNNENYCARCFDESFAHCECCNESFEKRLLSKFCGKFWCGECYQSNIRECDHCGEENHKDNLIDKCCKKCHYEPKLFRLKMDDIKTKEFVAKLNVNGTIFEVENLRIAP